MTLGVRCTFLRIGCDFYEMMLSSWQFRRVRANGETVNLLKTEGHSRESPLTAGYDTKAVRTERESLLTKGGK